MKDDVFIDTNLWIYLYSEKEKGEKIRDIVDEHFENIIARRCSVNSFTS